ncbi:MAG: trypsin-like serine protease [Dehalococcoidia bacterium]|nr:trypsin-like serine protease [Dehalococcoidia bacterium]
MRKRVVASLASVALLAISIAAFAFPPRAAPAQMIGPGCPELAADSDTLGYWNFDEPGGPALDSTANGNDGTVAGALRVPGLNGGALSFDGVDDSVDMGDQPELNVGTGDFTIEACVKTTSVEASMFVTGKNVPHYGPGYELRVAGGRGYCFVRDFDANGAHAPGHELALWGPSVNDGAWHHILCTRHGNDATLYVDGTAAESGSVALMVTLTSNQPFTVGRINSGSIPADGWAFEGEIDEVRVSSVARVPAPVDTTPPAALPTQTPLPNASGWNNQDVTIAWNWADEPGGSGIDPGNCTTTSASSGEGTLVLSATCRDAAGNAGFATITVKVDKTPPNMPRVFQPGAGGVYARGFVRLALYACQPDSGAPIACSGEIPLGMPIDTEAVGGHVFVVEAQDLAGNQSRQTVSYEVADGRACLSFGELAFTEPAFSNLIECLAYFGARGRDATTSEFPWLAAIVLQKTDGPYHCEGALIQPLWVITAAHCVKGALSIEVAFKDDNPFLQEPAEAVFLAESWVYNRAFDDDWWCIIPFTCRNDVALVRLAVPVPTSIATVLPIPSSHPPLLSLATAAGWAGPSAQQVGGENGFGLYSSLRAMDLRIAAGFGQVVGGGALCRGDSGTPLVVFKNGQAMLAGVLTGGARFSQDCASTVKYTDVLDPSNLTWIQQTVHGD